jgi:hypothetical protein
MDRRPFSLNSDDPARGDVADQGGTGASSGQRRSQSWRVRFAWPLSLLSSAVLHLGVLLAMFAVWTWSMVPSGGVSEERRVVTVVSDAERLREEPLPVTQLDRDAAERTAPESEPATSFRIRPEELSEWLRRELEDQLRAVEEQPADANVERLEELGERLHRLSTERRVNAITDRVAQALGTGERTVTSSDPSPPIPENGPPATADAPSESEEPFDYSRAQFENVLKQVDDEGRVTYTGLLADPEGRTRQVELDAAEGEELYRLFETIRRYPLLEQVYRKVVMSLLDRMVEQNRLADPAVSPEPPSRGSSGASASTSVTP